MPAANTRPATLKPLAPFPHLIVLGFCLLSISLTSVQAFRYYAGGPVYSDFRIFMTGIHVISTGQRHDLYKFETQRLAQIDVYPATSGFGMLPFNHLAFELLFYWPVSYFPFYVAMAVWAAINVGFIFLIGWLLKPYTLALTAYTRIPITLWLASFYPVLYVLGEGQDSLLLLLVLALTLRCLDSGRDFLAGFLLAAGCFKFHLSLLIAFFALVLARKWRGIAGYALGGFLCLAVSILMVGGNFFDDYLYMLRNQERITPWCFTPRYMPNLRGILDFVLAQHLDQKQIFLLIMSVSALITVLASWRIVRASRPHNLTLLFSLAILTTVLVSYHLYMQDLAIAALPVLLLLDCAIRNCKPNMHRWNVLLIVSIAAIFLYRICAQVAPILLEHCCYLALPLLLFWVAALKIFDAGGASMPGDLEWTPAPSPSTSGH